MSTALPLISGTGDGHVNADEIGSAARIRDGVMRRDVVG
jgi:hypothetical protein